MQSYLLLLLLLRLQHRPRGGKECPDNRPTSLSPRMPGHLPSSSSSVINRLEGHLEEEEEALPGRLITLSSSSLNPCLSSSSQRGELSVSEELEIMEEVGAEGDVLVAEEEEEEARHQLPPQLVRSLERLEEGLVVEVVELALLYKKGLLLPVLQQLEGEAEALLVATAVGRDVVGLLLPLLLLDPGLNRAEGMWGELQPPIMPQGGEGQP